MADTTSLESSAPIPHGEQIITHFRVVIKYERPDPRKTS